MSLLLPIATSSVLGIIAFATLLFVPAGTLHYWQGWALPAVFAVMSLAPTMFTHRDDPYAGAKAETDPSKKR